MSKPYDPFEPMFWSNYKRPLRTQNNALSVKFYADPWLSIANQLKPPVPAVTKQARWVTKQDLIDELNKPKPVRILPEAKRVAWARSGWDDEYEGSDSDDSYVDAGGSDGHDKPPKDLAEEIEDLDKPVLGKETRKMMRDLEAHKSSGKTFNVVISRVDKTMIDITDVDFKDDPNYKEVNEADKPKHLKGLKVYMFEKAVPPASEGVAESKGGEGEDDALDKVKMDVALELLEIRNEGEKYKGDVYAVVTDYGKGGLGSRYGVELLKGSAPVDGKSVPYPGHPTIKIGEETIPLFMYKEDTKEEKAPTRGRGALKKSGKPRGRALSNPISDAELWKLPPGIVHIHDKDGFIIKGREAKAIYVKQFGETAFNIAYKAIKDEDGSKGKVSKGIAPYTNRLARAAAQIKGRLGGTPGGVASATTSSKVR